VGGNKLRFWARHSANLYVWFKNNLISFVALLVAIAALFVSCLQLDEAKRAFAVERAYLLNNGFSGYSGLPEPGAQASFSFKNFGKTPAEYRDGTAHCKFSNAGAPDIHFAGQMPGFTDERGLVPPGVMIDKEQMLRPPFLVALDATKQQIEQARLGNGKIYCQSLLRYADVRNYEHTTRLCFVFNFGTKGFLLCSEKGTNYHN